MKAIFSGAIAMLAGSTIACLLDGDYGDCVHPEFHRRQRESYMMYYSLMRSHGHEQMSDYHPWAAQHKPGASKYAYSEYIPGENPYEGRWKGDDSYCWLSAKDAARASKAQAALAAPKAAPVETKAMPKASWAQRMQSMQSVIEAEAEPVVLEAPAPAPAPVAQAPPTWMEPPHHAMPAAPPMYDVPTHHYDSYYGYEPEYDPYYDPYYDEPYYDDHYYDDHYYDDHYYDDHYDPYYDDDYYYEDDYHYYDEPEQPWQGRDEYGQSAYDYDAGYLPQDEYNYVDWEPVDIGSAADLQHRRMYGRPYKMGNDNYDITGQRSYEDAINSIYF